jgi:hypothetical protein
MWYSQVFAITIATPVVAHVMIIEVLMAIAIAMTIITMERY